MKLYKGTDNSITLTGNLGQDPELKDVGETQVVNVTLATKRKSRDEDVTDWHRLAIWGRSAQAFMDFCRRGSKVTVRGEQQHQQYEKDGQKRTASQVFVKEWLILDPKDDAPRQNHGATPEDMNDDIPF